MTEFDQHRTRRVRGEPTGDEHRAKLVVEATVFSFGHAANPSADDDAGRNGPRRSGAIWPGPFLLNSRSGVHDLERLAADDCMHWTVEFGFGLPDHILP